MSLCQLKTWQHVYLNLQGIKVPVEKSDENDYGSSVNRCLFAYGKAVKYITPINQPELVTEAHADAQLRQPLR